MISLKINTNIDILPDDVEKEIIKAINKKAPTCYKKMSGREIKYLENTIINSSKFSKFNINLEQIQSIRSSYIKNKMIKKHSYLISNTKRIVEEYKAGKNILSISKKYDGSPLNIMRIILSVNNSKDKVKKLFNKPQLLNEYDQ
jgi:Mor family transcriptional regulator